MKFDKNYNYRNIFNNIRQVLPITAARLALSSQNQYKTPYKTLDTKRRRRPFNLFNMQNVAW